jgi:uncharacterized protein
MTLPHLSLLFAGLCALVQTVLTAMVISRRIQARVSLLDGGDQTLIRRIRAHGNFIETAPIALLLLALLEMNGLGAAWLWGFGSMLIAARLLHAFGLMARNARWARLLGMAMTLAVISIEGVACLLLFAR